MKHLQIGLIASLLSIMIMPDIFAKQNFGSVCGGNISMDSITVYSTIYSIGIEWNLLGDENHNATCKVQYRVANDPLWKEAQDLYRVDFEGYDMFAGSILFLIESTNYEIKLEVEDPDGGRESKTIFHSTKAKPKMPSNGRVFHVIPGLGGGDGSDANPFKGIDFAQTNALAGDVFLLHAGDYGTQGQIYFNVGGAMENHIVWTSANDGPVIMNQIRVEADYIWLNNINFIYNDDNKKYGLRTSPPGPKGIVLTNNTFDGCHICIYLNDGGSNWYVTDNVIRGDKDPINGSDFSGEGIELWYTSGHTIAYNRISNVADGISYPHKNVDIFNNDIFDTTDDGIEGDYGHNNIRIWRNRISNAYNNGISFQPMNGAPWYVLYNQVAAPGENVIKLRSRIDRVLLAHNTLVAWSGPVGSGSEFLKNIQSHNNLWISVQDRYIWENGKDGGINWKTNLDYDGFDWGSYLYAFKWGKDVRLKDLNAFQMATGQEQNGIKINRETCFDTFQVNAPPPASIPFQYMTLADNCEAINAGLVLKNINDDYIGEAPDLGAYEYSGVLPHYGPRDGLIITQDEKTPYHDKIDPIISLYPNPVNEFLKWKSSEFDILSYQILDLNGNYTKVNTAEMKIGIDTKSLVPGMYFLKYTHDDQIKFIKFIKE